MTLSLLSGNTILRTSFPVYSPGDRYGRSCKLKRKLSALDTRGLVTLIIGYKYDSYSLDIEQRYRCSKGHIKKKFNLKEFTFVDVVTTRNSVLPPRDIINRYWYIV